MRNQGSWPDTAVKPGFTGPAESRTRVQTAEEGFGFHWEPFSTKPYFILPGGTERCELESIDNVPYLRDTMNALPGGAFPAALPAVSGETLVEQASSSTNGAVY